MKHYASCSFGKDSVATVLLALEHGEPLDGVIWCEVMFDHARGISGELPEHVEWIYNTAIPAFERMGVKTTVVRGEKDYLQLFYKRRVGGKYAGKLWGFPIGGRCAVNSNCKVGPIRKHMAQLEEHVTYIGIAIDEPERLARLKPGQVSLLAKYGYTEQMAYDLCAKHALLSPIYAMSSRGGCWFCPNARISYFAEIKQRHPGLWEELEMLSRVEGTCRPGFKWGLTVQEVAAKADKYLKTQEAKSKQLTLF
jgi:3'-phosphoadenosine 5'-phosphosulfate sulfotransferase (PAPS reductase)/FAD synthetase